MKSRLLVSAVGAPVLLYVVLWGPPAALVVSLAALAAVAAWELAHCAGVPGRSFPMFLTVAAAAFTVCLAWVEPEILGHLWTALILVLFFHAVCRGGEVSFQQVMACVAAGMLIPYSFSTLLLTWQEGIHRGYLILPFVFSFMSDTGGYFAGRAFGRHKLAPRISPHKTVEGAVGGLVGNLLGGAVFAFIMETWCGQNISYPLILALGLVCSVAAQVGDLSFSLVKREFGVKDYGRIFLEHGGVLDRFDSVIFVLPFLTAVLRLVLSFD